MRVLGKKSADPLYGVFFGFAILLVSIICTIIIGSSAGGYALIVPELAGVVLILIYGLPLFRLPKDIILYDEEKKELIVYIQRNEKKVIPLRELTNMYYSGSGIRKSYTGEISFIYGENYTVASYIANAKYVAERIEELKKLSDETPDERFAHFEKL